MLKSWKTVAGIIVAASLVLLIWLLSGSGNPACSRLPGPPPGMAKPPIAATAQTPSPSPASSETIENRLMGELELLRKVHGEQEGQARIREMMAWLLESPREEAVTAIQAVLKSRENALAFGRFAPGRDGFLLAYPSFRTALLDTLEQLDPAAAVEAGKTILSESENPDEWALALRTLARYGATPSDQAVLHEKVSELLRKEPWLEDPTYSYLHAFDAAVAAGQEDSLGQLDGLLVLPSNKAVTHAATLSVDRFFQLHSTEGIHYLNTHPDFLDSSGGFRASLVARANPESPIDMQAVEMYLSSPEVASEEKEVFFQSFPNFNSTYSYNLITGSLLLSRPTMRERSFAALNQLKVWSEDARYSEFGDAINSARERLVKIWEVGL